MTYRSTKAIQSLLISVYVCIYVCVWVCVLRDWVVCACTCEGVCVCVCRRYTSFILMQLCTRDPLVKFPLWGTAHCTNASASKSFGGDHPCFKGTGLLKLESINKRVNYHSKDITQTQQQRHSSVHYFSWWGKQCFCSYWFSSNWHW